MSLKSICRQMMSKEDPKVYQLKDSANLKQNLRVRDFLALGVGTIVSTGIFTLPGIVAAEHAGPAVAISFIIAAIIAGMSALAYAEMASAMPYAGSAFSWINVVFGEFWGWIAGWALLAEYFIAGAFVASGLSANLQSLLAASGLQLPNSIAHSLGVQGGMFDLIAVLAIVITFFILRSGNTQTARIENTLVVLKVVAILVFVLVGLSAIHPHNYVPFIPKHRINPDGTNFGGFSGIYAGVSMIFIAYLGFDALAANSAEAKNPKKTMPRAIIGSLLIAIALYVAVSLVLVGMFKYTNYNNVAAPVGWALIHSGHPIIASIIQFVAVMGMFTALIASLMAGSRLMYSFGRDGMLPQWLGKVNHKDVPINALSTLAIAGIIIGAILPFSFISQLISAGTLIAFMFVSLGIYALRKREGNDINNPEFKMPFYPVLPALAFLGTLSVFWNLDPDAKLYALIWFLIGAIIYFVYGMRHNIKDNPKLKK